MLLELGALRLEVVVAAVELLLDRPDVRRQQPVQTERGSLVLGKGAPLVEDRAIEQGWPCQRDLQDLLVCLLVRDGSEVKHEGPPIGRSNAVSAGTGPGRPACVEHNPDGRRLCKICSRFYKIRLKAVPGPGNIEIHSLDPEAPGRGRPADAPARPAFLRVHTVSVLPETLSLKCDHGLRRQAIVESVLKDVVQGVLRPGQHLVAQALARRLGVSLTPVREALIALAGIGIVDLLPNRGAVVRRLTTQGHPRGLCGPSRAGVRGGPCRLRPDRRRGDESARRGDAAADRGAAAAAGKLHRGGTGRGQPAPRRDRAVVRQYAAGQGNRPPDDPLPGVPRCRLGVRGGPLRLSAAGRRGARAPGHCRGPDGRRSPCGVARDGPAYPLRDEVLVSGAAGAAGRRAPGSNADPRWPSEERESR